MTLIIIHTDESVNSFDHTLVRNHIRQLETLNPAVAIVEGDDLLKVTQDWARARDILAEIDGSIILLNIEFDMLNPTISYWTRMLVNMLEGEDLYNPWDHIPGSWYEWGKGTTNVVRCEFNWMYPNETRASSDDQSKFPPYHIRDFDDDPVGKWHYLDFNECIADAKKFLPDYPNGLQICNGHSNTYETLGKSE